MRIKYLSRFLFVLAMALGMLVSGMFLPSSEVTGSPVGAHEVKTSPLAAHLQVVLLL